MAHAFLSPSGAPAWVRCNAKPWREKDMPDVSGPEANEGTAAHFLLEQCLLAKVDAEHFLGNRILVSEVYTGFHTDGAYPVDQDICREVQKTLDAAWSLAEGGTLYAEQTLPISQFTGEDGATGTSDIVIVKTAELASVDLKFGRGVQVFAEGNEQLLLYGGAAVDDLDVLGEVKTLRLVISQPRLNHHDEWVLPIEEARSRLKVIREIADRINAGPGGLTAVPGDKQCKFCKVKSTCQEHREFVLGTVAGEFVDLEKGFVQVSIDQAEKLLAQSFGVKPAAVDLIDGVFVVKKPTIKPDLEAAEEKLASAEDSRLATLMDAADMLEGFAKAVRAEVERRLLQGIFTDKRYKLVEGKRGARAWNDEAAVEAELKKMRLKVDQMYDFKLISPTSAEELLLKTPRRWAKLQGSITQTGGKPSVAPASDKRPALSMAIAEQFETLPDDLEDLI